MACGCSQRGQGRFPSDPYTTGPMPRGPSSGRTRLQFRSHVACGLWLSRSFKSLRSEERDSFGMIAAPNPYECVRQRLFENATVAVARGEAEYEAVIVTLRFQCIGGG